MRTFQDDDDDMLPTITEEKSDSESLDSKRKSAIQSAHQSPDAPDMANDVAETPQIGPGSIVQFHSLGEMSELNGTTGTIEYFLDDIQRWSVRCHHDDHVVNAKPENLRIVRQSKLLSKDPQDKKKKKKKHKKDKDSQQSNVILETSQQILVDLCNEMKSLKASITSITSDATNAMKDNLTTNTSLLHTLQDQMDLLRSNLHELDATIESKATPAQIEEMGRIRAVQEILAAAAADKDKTIEVYETHAMRGYEEIERLRDDLEWERGESARLREEIDGLRIELGRIRGGAVGFGPPLQVTDNGRGGSAAVSGLCMSLKESALDGATVGTFDDMTVDSKLSTENTVAYETKSLKKRIIHMKKKLQVAQLEAKEAEQLRTESENMRVQMEGMRREGEEKDRIIQSLRREIAELKTYPPRSPATHGQHDLAASQTSRRKSGHKWFGI